MTTKDETLTNIARSTLEYLGGRENINVIAEHIRENAPDVYMAYTFAGFKKVVAAALTRKDSRGLSWALALTNGPEGKVYVQRAFFDIEAYREVIIDHYRRGLADIAVGDELRKECQERLGVSLVRAELMLAARAEGAA